VEIAPAQAGPRPADRNIAEVAGTLGEYRPSAHRIVAEASRVRVPGGATMTPMSRAMCGGWRRFAGPGSWSGSTLTGGASRRTSRRACRRSRRPAPWTDDTTHSFQSRPRIPDRRQWRHLARPGTGLAQSHAARSDRLRHRGRQRHATSQGRARRKGYAWRAQDGTIRAPKHLVARLERGDIERVGKSMAADKPAPFKRKAEGERVSGYSSISWDFTRTRGIGIGM